jgi:hypothetical protein
LGLFCWNDATAAVLFPEESSAPSFAPISGAAQRISRQAIQHVGASDYEMQVVTYEMLVQEEKNRQVARAILTGLAAGANAYSASQAGYGTYTTPNGRTGAFYSPTAAVITQNNAAFQNDAMNATHRPIGSTFFHGKTARKTRGSNPSHKLPCREMRPKQWHKTQQWHREDERRSGF